MATLLSTLDTPQKTAYQTYTVEHGIERLSIKIPLKESISFEEAFAISDKSKLSITKLVSQFGGSIVGKR